MRDRLIKKYRKTAKKVYEEDGCIEIDDDAEVSSSEDGAYIAAWVWIGKEEIDESSDP